MIITPFCRKEGKSQAPSVFGCASACTVATTQLRYSSVLAASRCAPLNSFLLGSLAAPWALYHAGAGASNKLYPCLLQKHPCEPFRLWTENGSTSDVDAQDGGKTAGFRRSLMAIENPAAECDGAGGVSIRPVTKQREGYCSSYHSYPSCLHHSFANCKVKDLSNSRKTGKEGSYLGIDFSLSLQSA